MVPLYGTIADTYQRIRFIDSSHVPPTVNTSASYDIHSADLIEALSWDTLDKRRLRAKSILMYKILNDDPTTNLRNSFVRRNTNQTNYHLQIV